MSLNVVVSTQVANRQSMLVCVTTAHMRLLHAVGKYTVLTLPMQAMAIKDSVDDIMLRHSAEAKDSVWAIGIEDCLKVCAFVRCIHRRDTHSFQCVIEFQHATPKHGDTRSNEQVWVSATDHGSIGSAELTVVVGSLVCYDTVKRPNARLVMVHPNSARGYFGIKKTSRRVASSEVNDADAKSNIKEEVFKVVAPFIKGFEFEYTSTGTPRSTNFDVTDSFLIAHYTRKRFLHDWLMQDETVLQSMSLSLSLTHLVVVRSLTCKSLP
jgi:hypothetical protein